MFNFHRIKTATPTELLTLVENKPRLIYSASRPLEVRTADEYKACCVAALRSLSRKAGHNFPQKGTGDNHWDAHHITKRIFEEQNIFDPYADQAFLDEITPLCTYYVLRYVAPEENPKASDFTPDQFAACFTSKGALYLRKRGCDFWPDSPEREQSDLGNFRLYLEYANRNGQYIVGDVSCAHRLVKDARGNVKPGPSIGMYTDFQQEEESGTYCYGIPGYSAGAYDYTKADLLRLINSDSAVQYDRVEVME